MATQVLHCAGCNVNFRAKTYDPAKTYKCPKCAGRLQPQADAKGDDGVTLQSKAPGKRAAAKDPLVGSKIGQYKVLKKLGQGGMGAVYQATHLELGRTVALKILPPRLAQDDPAALERFKREARSAAVLNHPNVVTIHYVGSEGEHHFIEQEFVDGESLQDRLEREGKLPIDDATRIVQDAAGALAAAHEQNIIHRDIKPANIMLTKKGEVKVMDFGLAKDVTAPSQLTMSGHIMGTPYYMSPEQCQAKKLDGRSDVYSLGATYYHLLTGSFPYSGDSLFDIMYQHKEGPIPQVQEKRPDAPASVQPVIDQAMAKKPEDRFQTMEDFAAALSNVAQPPSAVDRGRDAEAAEGRSHRVPGSAATMAHAGLGDVIDTAAERDRHLHTRRIDGRLKDVRAFAKQWASLSDMVKRARKKGKPSDKQMREFADVRDIIARRYSEVMKRLEDPTTPGHRVVSACKTGAALGDILELPDDGYAAFAKHLDAGADLLRQYVDFLDAGKRDLLKQSTWYFYWDKYLHNPKAAAAVLVAGVVLACVIGWQVAVHWPKGKKVSATEVTESTEGSGEGTTKDTKSTKAAEPTGAASAQSALRTPHSAIPPAPSVVKSESAIGTPRYELWKRIGPTVSVPGPDGKIQQLPAGVVQDVKYTPDGKLLAVAHSYGVDLWDTSTLKIVRRLDGHEATVTAVDFSRDGRKVATGSKDMTVRLSDMESGRELWHSERQGASVESVAFSPNGRVLASGSHSTVQLWDGETGAHIRSLKGHTTFVYAVAFSPDGRSVASGSYDRTARVWDTETGAEKRVLTGHSSHVKAVAFSPDGRKLAAGQNCRGIRLWDAHTGSLSREIPDVSYLYSLAFSPDGRRLACGSGSEVRIWDSESWEPLASLKAHADWIPSVAFSPDGQMLASGSRDGTVRVWDLAKGTVLGTLKGYATPIWSVAFSPDGRRFASGGTDRNVWIWDAKAGTPILSLKGHPYAVLCVAFHPSGGYLASATWADPTIRFWDVQKGSELRSIKTPASVCSLGFSSDGRYLASGDSARAVRVWDAEKNTLLHTLEGHRGSVNTLSFSPNGWLATGGAGREIRLWDTGKGAELRTLEGHAGGVTSVVFSPDGAVLASVASDRTIRLWHAANGEELRTIRTGAESSYRVVFSPDGRCLASGSAGGGAIRLWDADTGQARQMLAEHRDKVWGIAFAPDGGLLVSVSEDGSICLWRRAGEGTTEATESTEKSPQSAIRTPQSAIPSVPSVVKSDLPKSFINPIDGSEIIHVPAGTFKMGSDHVNDNEKPMHEVHLPAFYISKCEITKRQFKKFVDAKPDWRKGRIKKRYHDGNYLKRWQRDSYPSAEATHPVVYVSWFAAKAYCNWAGGKLPTEAEWEKAARGADGRAYPWGNDWDRSRCNSGSYWAKRDLPDRESLKKWKQRGGGAPARITDVGVFPSGASPYGLLDMAGNVWEWCSSAHKPYPYEAHDGREDLNDSSCRRVLRGGSRGDSLDNVRSAYRGDPGPKNAWGTFGFRLCVSGDAARKFIDRAKPEKPKSPVPSAASVPSVPSVVARGKAKLPPGFDRAFMIPDADKDQYGNPVVTRGRDAASGDAMRVRGRDAEAREAGSHHVPGIHGVRAHPRGRVPHGYQRGGDRTAGGGAQGPRRQDVRSVQSGRPAAPGADHERVLPGEV